MDIYSYTYRNNLKTELVTILKSVQNRISIRPKNNTSVSAQAHGEQTSYMFSWEYFSFLILLMCIHKTFKSKLFTTLAVLFKAPSQTEYYTWYWGVFRTMPNAYDRASLWKRGFQSLTIFEKFHVPS